MNIVDTIYTLKLAFGPMRGTELIIKYGRCIITAAKDVSYSCIYDANNNVTLVNIPSDDDPFILRLTCEYADIKSDVEKLTDNIIMNAEIEYDGKHRREKVVFQRMMFPEYAAFLVKPAYEPWHPLKSDLDDNSSKYNTMSDLENSGRFFNKKSVVKLFPIGLFLLAMGMFTVYLLMNNKNDDSDKAVMTLSEILRGSPEPVYIYHDHNHSRNIVLVNKKNVADWVRQRLVNTNSNKNIEVYLINNLEDGINEKLRLLDMPILKVDLNSYESITVRLLNTDNNIANKEVVEKFLAKEIPYIKNINVLFYNGDDLFDKAIQGIQKSGVQYYSITHDKKKFIIIKADLNDEQLQTISSFITSFRKIWGDNYISFSVLLATDYLSGKSFLSGKNGYILLNNNHWYFKSE